MYDKVCMQVMCVCKLCVHVSVFVHMNMRVCVYVYVFAYVCIYVRMCIHTYIYAYIAYIHIYTYTHIHVYMHTRMHTYIHAYIYQAYSPSAQEWFSQHYASPSHNHHSNIDVAVVNSPFLASRQFDTRLRYQAIEQVTNRYIILNTCFGHNWYISIHVLALLTLLSVRYPVEIPHAIKKATTRHILIDVHVYKCVFTHTHTVYVCVCHTHTHSLCVRVFIIHTHTVFVCV